MSTTNPLPNISLLIISLTNVLYSFLFFNIIKGLTMDHFFLKMQTFIDSYYNVRHLNVPFIFVYLKKKGFGGLNFNKRWYFDYMWKMHLFNSFRLFLPSKLNFLLQGFFQILMINFCLNTGKKCYMKQILEEKFVSSIKNFYIAGLLKIALIVTPLGMFSTRYCWYHEI